MAPYNRFHNDLEDFSRLYRDRFGYVDDLARRLKDGDEAFRKRVAGALWDLTEKVSLVDQHAFNSPPGEMMDPRLLGSVADYRGLLFRAFREAVALFKRAPQAEKITSGW